MNAAVSRNDEFLFHLHRGSALLMDGDVHGAKVELEHALAFQPQDAKSQDLLAGVYFRLGLYPRAIEIWEALVDAFPAEPTLRINLGLAYFKTGQTAAAREQLRAALRDAPEHARAWGYLGLAEWRLGHLEAAREAFVRGQQPAMVTRMEEAMAGAASAPPVELPPELAAAEPEAQPRPRAADALGDDEGGGTALFAAPPPSASVPPGPPASDPAARATPITHRLFAVPPPVRRPRRDGGVFERPSVEAEAAHVAERARTREGPPGTREAAAAHTAVTSPGTYGAPRPRPPEPTDRAVPLDALVAGALATPPEGACFGVASSGELVVQSAGPTNLRYAPLVALRGELRLAPLPRAPKDETPLGGEHGLMRWQGPIYALIEPREGLRFQVLDLAGATLYLREDVLFGFDDGVRYESATLRLEEEPTHVLKLTGEGQAVLQLPSPLLALSVGGSEPLMVQPARVVGWSGRLFPTPRQGTAPYGATAPRLAFRGEGAVLVGAPTESS